MTFQPKYLVRFDDICPTMKWTVWDRTEEILRFYSVRPIMSVIPDNQDNSLYFDPPNPHFWERVRQWQSWGWTIGLHGYQHRYRSNSAGIVGTKDASEFAGVPLRQQLRSLREAAGICRDQGVEPRVWVAPGHSFDRTTLTLLSEIGILNVSDGLFMVPRRDSSGVLWIPQQLWRFRRFPLGVWTVCFHPNRWTETDVEAFASDIAVFRRVIVDLEDIVKTYRAIRRVPVDGLVPRMYRYFVRRRQGMVGTPVDPRLT
jgi:predicted deacetylase